MLVLERVRQLVRDQQLADEVAAGERADETHGDAALVGGIRHQRERLRPRVVQRRDLPLEQTLECRTQRRPRGDQAEARVDRAQALQVAGGIREVDLVGERGAQRRLVERLGGNRSDEREAAQRRQARPHVGEGVGVDLAVTDHPPAPAGGEREQEEDERRGPAPRAAVHSVPSSVRIAG